MRVERHHRGHAVAPHDAVSLGEVSAISLATTIRLMLRNCSNGKATICCAPPATASTGLPVLTSATEQPRVSLRRCTASRTELQVRDLGDHRPDAVIEGGFARAHFGPGNVERNVEQPVLVRGVGRHRQEKGNRDRQRYGCVERARTVVLKTNHSNHDEEDRKQAEQHQPVFVCRVAVRARRPP